MDLVELGAGSMDLVDLEFLELGCLTGKKWSGAVFGDLELRGALPNTPLSYKDYSGLMMDELEDLHMIRLRALENIEKNKLRVAKYYNKKVKVRQFAEGDLVWKALLPIGTKYSEFGKWSPNWEGPFRVVRCVPGNAYMLKTLLGEEFSAAIMEEI
jgi:hypothetical protein